ncbi:hypothetical protein CON65_10540 [Bacillus pseudomycoides]|uniref:Phr family secreted Rap phosphatase inhibitor n=1 Tax=Bacillus pseudomycoides TaxID=64104 RepID=A0AA91VCW7_9BACI|nr:MULTISPECIES: hypothetical protein [Bacillus]PEB47831.1 hypothetical protein COO03_25145 [Bacillus sp. AFS098217]PED82654.1 hypothetical protein CON65_10540 [Bacillus pseudomycoides]PEU09136.1 hypothetical protein CN525_25110 [Bacillus sp. AFS014408]PEU13663.1 hypothetical protein CN524_11175 [Bacillus sp. AFS019443]PFW60094.1 hypothetical protein COL20_23110 [Bacillus sp. AFS075034]
MKKLLVGTVSFVSVLGIGLFTNSYSSQADHGRPPAPSYAPAYGHGETWISDGHTGGIAVADSHADFPAPQEN